MVKQRFKAITEKRDSKGCCEIPCTPRKIAASTPYGTCTERLSPFGGLLGLIKFLDLLKFEEVFDEVYRGPSREPNLGHYRMVVDARQRWNELGPQEKEVQIVYSRQPFCKCTY